jgi:23S rRNA (guanosine2251-2'-O)-methyltransferase
MSEQTALEGFISVNAALQARNRDIYALYISKARLDQAESRLVNAARDQGAEVKRIGAEVIDRYASGKSHGGMIALVGPRRYLPLEKLAGGSTLPFVVMLDGIEDPFNFGLAIRSLYAAGVDGLVVRPRNWMSAAGIVARASAGASELMPTAVAETALAAAEFLKGRGLSVACAVRRDSVSIHDTRLAVPLFLVIGGEKRGISRPLLKKADLRLEIPYGRRFAHSLGTASAAAVLAFEIMRQRRRG